MSLGQQKIKHILQKASVAMLYTTLFYLTQHWILEISNLMAFKCIIPNITIGLSFILSARLL